MSRGSSSSTHRTHEVHARRQDGRGRVFARDATRPASLDGPVERSPSRSRRHPRSTRLRAAVPETAQRFLLLFFSSPSVLRCSSGECGLTTNIALPNSQTRARVSPPPFAGPSSERDEHPSASALAEWRLRRGAHPPSMAEPTRLLCREKRNASKAKRLNPEPLPISEPLKSPHLKRRSAAPPRETLRVSLGGYAPRRGGLRPLPSTSAERRETRPGGPVRGRGRDGGCELRPELAAGASRTRRLALSTAPWIARRRDAHPPVVAPEVVHHVPGSDAGELEHRLHHLLRRRADRVRDTSNESRCQTAKPERGCPPHSLPARVTVVGTRWYSHLRKDDTATLGKVLPFFFFSSA